MFFVVTIFLVAALLRCDLSGKIQKGQVVTKQGGELTMPIYEYKCKECGQVSEIMEGVGSHSDDHKCKNCGSDNLVKILSYSSISMGGRTRPRGLTCCGREERCEKPPCSTDGVCTRD